MYAVGPTARAAIAAGLAIVAGAAGPVVQAQTYPTKPIRLVVGFAAGGPADIVARVLGATLADTMGQQFVVENRGGAGGTIGTEAVARATPDGYTLLMTPIANAVNESMYKGRKINLGPDLMAVTSVAETANVLVVHPSLGVKSLAELIALAKSKPGELVYASAGRGTATHLTSELFDMMAGIKTRPVHYKGGGETVKDLLSGEVKMMFSSIAPVLEFVRAGQMLGLATTGPKRDAAFPDLPTVAEAGRDSGLSGFDVRLWLGVLAPAGTPRDVVEQLSSATNTALAKPDMTKTLAAQGFEPRASSPAEFEAFYRREVAKWRSVVEATGMVGD